LPGVVQLYLFSSSMVQVSRYSNFSALTSSFLAAIQRSMHMWIPWKPFASAEIKSAGHTDDLRMISLSREMNGAEYKKYSHRKSCLSRFHRGFAWRHRDLWVSKRWAWHTAGVLPHVCLTGGLLGVFGLGFLVLYNFFGLAGRQQPANDKNIPSD
jgi:hypothetical protein